MAASSAEGGEGMEQRVYENVRIMQPQPEDYPEPARFEAPTLALTSVLPQVLPPNRDIILEDCLRDARQVEDPPEYLRESLLFRKQVVEQGLPAPPLPRAPPGGDYKECQQFR